MLSMLYNSLFLNNLLTVYIVLGTQRRDTLMARLVSSGLNLLTRPPMTRLQDTNNSFWLMSTTCTIHEASWSMRAAHTLKSFAIHHTLPTFFRASMWLFLASSNANGHQYTTSTRANHWEQKKSPRKSFLGSMLRPMSILSLSQISLQLSQRPVWFHLIQMSLLIS